MNARIRLPILAQLSQEIAPASRARTILRGGRQKREVERGREEYPEQVERPRTRSDCLPGGMNEARPCPFASCKYNLFLDVNKAGSIKENFPGFELHELPETCALDVADRGAVAGPEVAAMLNLSKQGAHLIFAAALSSLEKRFRAKGIDGDALDPETDLSAWQGTRHKGTR